MTTSFSRIGLRLRHVSLRSGAVLAALLVLALGAACGSDDPTEPIGTANCPAAAGAAPGNTLTVLGCGNFKPARTTSELFVRGTTAYTTTWGQRSLPGNVFYIWDVSGNTPGLVDSVVVSGAIAELGDIQISDDGKYLVVATEFAPGYLIVYDLADPRHPRELSRFSNELTAQGVHTACIRA